MTLGVILPAALALFAFVDIAVFRMFLSRGTMNAKSYLYFGGLSIALPIGTYVLLNWVVPEWGAIEVL